MAEQSVEEIRRLARNFLIGKGGPGDLEDLKRDMESDSQLPFELLQLMQAALDEVPPAGFSPDQWKEMDARIVSMTNPLLRTGLGKLSQIFSGLFKKRLKVEVPVAQATVVAPPALVALPVALPPEGESEGMEEMAPIATQAPPPPPPLPLPLPLPSLSLPLPLAATSLKVPVPVPTLKIVEPARPGKKSARWIWAPLILMVAVGLVLTVFPSLQPWKWRKPGFVIRPKAVKQAQPAEPAQPTLQPTVFETAITQATPIAPQTSLPSRSRGMIELSEPLPSELPPQTPQAGENNIRPGDLEAKDQAGNHGFPLP